MGNNEEGKPPKPENSSSPAPDEATVNVYPDWAGVQAYYGPRLAFSPYYSSAMASGHAPHAYMWPPPQHMMPPYGAPYAAVYTPGGVYAHPTAVPLGLHPHGHGIASSPAASEPVVLTSGKSSGNADCSLMKKLKGFDGLAMSIGDGNCNTDSAEGGSDHGLSQSGETEGSTDISNRHTTTDRTRKKPSREGTPTGSDGKAEKQASSTPSGEVTTAGATGKLGGTVPHAMAAMELKSSPTLDMKSSPTTVSQPCSMSGEAWLQNERELKRERRKQSNRESARRSRLRKQAETEKLAVKVEALNAENTALKSEVGRLQENSKKLRLENAALVEKLKNAQLGNTEGTSLVKIVGNKTAASVSTENLLSRVNNMGCTEISTDDEGIVYEKNSNSGAKLHQLLDASPRADAVAAG